MAAQRTNRNEGKARQGKFTAATSRIAQWDTGIKTQQRSLIDMGLHPRHEIVKI